jgi:hypothetical protein
MKWCNMNSKCPRFFLLGRIGVHSWYYWIPNVFPKKNACIFWLGTRKGMNFFVVPNVISLSSIQIPKKFPQVFIVFPKMFQITPHFYPICFAQSWTLKLKKCNPQLRVPTICTQFVPTKFPMCSQHVFNHTSFCSICFSQSCPFGSSLDAFLNSLIDSNAEE